MSYQYKGPVDVNKTPNLSKIKGKTVLITGAGSGIGEAYATAFASNGAFVAILDFNETYGREVEKKLKDKGYNVRFIKADICSWEEQLAAFKETIEYSPKKAIDVVIGNAGKSGADPVYHQENTDEPTKPDLSIAEIDFMGTLYTVKLALHYFQKTPRTDDHDKCLILTGSIVSYLDWPGAIQYNGAKFGVRGMMRSLRRTMPRDGGRVNIISPFFVHTRVHTPEIVEWLEKKGIEKVEKEDVGTSVVFIAADKSINGRAFALLPRSMAPKGFVDIDNDDFAHSKFWTDLHELNCSASIRAQIDPSKQG
jgi:NAD(P)-dependent dehydrogenase (short-subunit alcohol dehydrogenase family)